MFSNICRSTRIAQNNFWKTTSNFKATGRWPRLFRQTEDDLIRQMEDSQKKIGNRKTTSTFEANVRRPHLPTFFDPSNINWDRAFSARLAVHIPRLAILYCCTGQQYTSLCTLVLWNLASVEVWRANIFWPMRAEQYNLHEPHRPITGFKICCERH